MFEKGKAIREAKKAEILEKARLKARREALQEERQRIKTEMERNGTPITPEIEAILSGDGASDGLPFILA